MMLHRSNSLKWCLCFMCLIISYLSGQRTLIVPLAAGATADWWSVGVILFELIVGIPPFNAEHPQVTCLHLQDLHPFLLPSFDLLFYPLFSCVRFVGCRVVLVLFL